MIRETTARMARLTDLPTAKAAASRRDLATPAMILEALGVAGSELTDDEIVRFVSVVCERRRQPMPLAATIKTCRSRMTRAGQIEAAEGVTRHSPETGSLMQAWRLVSPAGQLVLPV